MDQKLISGNDGYFHCWWWSTSNYGKKKCVMKYFIYKSTHKKKLYINNQKKYIFVVYDGTYVYIVPIYGFLSYKKIGSSKILCGIFIISPLNLVQSDRKLMGHRWKKLIGHHLQVNKLWSVLDYLILFFTTL